MTIVAALCCVAVAQGPEGGPNRERGGRFGGMRGGMPPGMGNPLVNMVSNPKMAEKLGLTAEQQAKLKELRENRKEDRELQEKARVATMKQFDLMKAEKIDEAAVMAAIDEVFELRKKMAQEQVKRLIAVKSILTPEQIKKAHEERRARREAGPRRNGPHGDGPRGRGQRRGKPEQPKE